jgi:hypothetical protein
MAEQFFALWRRGDLQHPVPSFRSHLVIASLDR